MTMSLNFQPFNVKKASDAELVSMLMGRKVHLNSPLVDLMGFNLRVAHKVCDGNAAGQYQDVVNVLEIARELTTRAMGQEIIGGESLYSPGAVKDYLRVLLGGKSQEEFWCVWLDSQHTVIEVEKMFVGSLAQTSVHPREVARSGLQKNAAALILAHNHPSGGVTPSRADELLTQTLKQSLALVDVRVIDHIIVGGTSTLSMAEHGLM